MHSVSLERTRGYSIRVREPTAGLSGSILCTVLSGASLPQLQVLTWRGLHSMKEPNSNSNTSDGVATLGLGPTLLIGAALASMVTSATMNYLYFRVRATSCAVRVFLCCSIVIFRGRGEMLHIK